MDKKMTSGEIAKKAGVSRKAVRLYDEKIEENGEILITCNSDFLHCYI